MTSQPIGFVERKILGIFTLNLFQEIINYGIKREFPNFALTKSINVKSRF